MDKLAGASKRVSKGRYKNIVRESDIRADPEYKQKKEFYDQLLVKVQINCNALQQNAIKEAKSIKDSLSVLISQLPARVQKLTITDFCKEFGFELIDGNLVMMEDANAAATSIQNQVYRTVQMTRTMNYENAAITTSGEVMSQIQVVRNGGSEPFLRMTKNNVSYDLTKQKTVVMSESDKTLIRAEIAVFSQMLKESMPK